MSFVQAHAEGLCLRYPENFGSHPNINYETVVNMLLRAIPLSQQVPYTWGFIDKPTEGQVILLFMPMQTSFPVDGIRFQDQETRYIIPVGSNRELEVTEAKYGFIPNSQDTVAWRVRRRYRLHKGGHPQLILVHYTRGPAIQINPSALNQPVRAYPLRTINEPAVYVIGDKMGQKVYAHGAAAPSGSVLPGGPTALPAPQQQGMHLNAATGTMPPMSMNLHSQQAMLAQQNSNMEALERRRDRERGRDRVVSMTGSHQRPPQPRIEDDDSADENDHISTRTLALTRYKRNHELMNDVFRHAAFGDKKETSRPSPYSIFDKSELEAKVVKLAAEIEEMKEKASERARARCVVEVDSAENQTTLDVDISMEVLGDGIAV